MDMHNFAVCVVSFRVTCWMFISSHNFFFSFFPFSSVQLQRLSQLQQSPFPLWFPLLVGVIEDATSTHWDICFQGSGLLISFSGTWPASICKVYIGLHELHVIPLMFLTMAFHLSGKVVALPLDNITTDHYFCNQGGTASYFLSREAF